MDIRLLIPYVWAENDIREPLFTWTDYIERVTQEGIGKNELAHLSFVVSIWQKTPEMFVFGIWQLRFEFIPNRKSVFPSIGAIGAIGSGVEGERA
jgi:hypothetical protein